MDTDRHPLVPIDTCELRKQLEFEICTCGCPRGAHETTVYLAPGHGRCMGCGNCTKFTFKYDERKQ